MGYIVDGGYKENTGIETTWQLMVACAIYHGSARQSWRLYSCLPVVYSKQSDPRYTEKIP